MAALAATYLTLLDLAKRTDPNGAIANIVEILQEQNAILDDIPFYQGNLKTGHRTTIRTGIPIPTWRQIGQGIQPSKSNTTQVTFGCGMLDDISEMDCKLADLSGDAMKVRFSEDKAFVQGFNKELARCLFLGNHNTSPSEFTGLAAYYNSLSAESGDNIIDAQGSGNDNASIYLIGWSEETIAGIVPEHSTAGLKMEDLGKQVSENAGGTNTRMLVYRTYFSLEAGLAVKNWQFGVRIANIDRSLLSSDPITDTTSANLPELMFQALDMLPTLDGVKPVFYMDRNVKTKLRQQLATLRMNSTLSIEDVGGRRTDLFQGYPIRRCDALAVDEARVV